LPLPPKGCRCHGAIEDIVAGAAFEIIVSGCKERGEGERIVVETHHLCGYLSWPPNSTSCAGAAIELILRLAAGQLVIAISAIVVGEAAAL